MISLCYQLFYFCLYIIINIKHFEKRSLFKRKEGKYMNLQWELSLPNRLGTHIDLTCTSCHPHGPPTQEPDYLQVVGGRQTRASHTIPVLAGAALILFTGWVHSKAGAVRGLRSRLCRWRDFDKRSGTLFSCQVSLPMVVSSHLPHTLESPGEATCRPLVDNSKDRSSRAPTRSCTASLSHGGTVI